MTPRIAVVLDDSAILTFCFGRGVAVGELLIEVADESWVVAVPGPCAAGAARDVIRHEDLEALARLRLLLNDPTVILVDPVLTIDAAVQFGSFLIDLHARHENAAAAMVSELNGAVPILTSEPQLYEPVPTLNLLVIGEDED